jgi:hypothetical protein
MDQYITVLTFTYPHELNIAKGRLQSEGIACNIKDGFTTEVNPFYSNAIGGVKLQVKESDKDRALEILKEGGFILPEPEWSGLPVMPETSLNICPACGSDELSKPRLSGAAFAISILLLGFPLPFFSKTRHCFNCGLDFKNKGK